MTRYTGWTHWTISLKTKENMMNVKKGSYKIPLVAGLVAIREDELSKQVADKNIKLALSNSIQGAVTIRKDLKQVFVDALNTKFAKNAADERVIDYYVRGILSGSTVPVENITTENDNRYYAPGELFLKS